MEELINTKALKELIESAASKALENNDEFNSALLRTMATAQKLNVKDQRDSPGNAAYAQMETFAAFGKEMENLKKFF